MMTENYDSSDSDDPDFVADAENDSANDSPGLLENEELSDDADEETSKPLKKKRKKSGGQRNTRNRNSLEKNTEHEEQETTDEKCSSPAEEKKKADELWKSFLSDTGSSCKRPSSDATTKTTNELKNCENSDKNTNKKTIPAHQSEQEKIPVTNVNMNENGKAVTSLQKNQDIQNKSLDSMPSKPVVKRGLSSILSSVGKKTKLSTLEKSKLDWNKYKQANNLQEEISTFNRGKSGYLEKQDFLNRTDSRQFELEKQLRNTNKRK